MANFAKAQLLKYGWTEGKGLGKNENGITEALKPKLKFNTEGLGHKLNEVQWWESAFNNAAKNVSVTSENNEVSISVADKNASVIAEENLKGNQSRQEQYNNFRKTCMLQDEKLIKFGNTNETKEEEEEKPVNVIPSLTDDELFKACGGRTAHKGARHGLSLNGKLERIARQEKQLLNLMSHFANKEIKNKSIPKIADDPENENEVDDNANAILAAIEPSCNGGDGFIKCKATLKRERKKIRNLSHLLSVSCNIDENNSSRSNLKRKRSKDTKTNTDNDITDDDILPTITSKEAHDMSVSTNPILTKKHKRHKKHNKHNIVKEDHNINLHSSKTLYHDSIHNGLLHSKKKRGQNQKNGEISAQKVSKYEKKKIVKLMERMSFGNSEDGHIKDDKTSSLTDLNKLGNTCTSKEALRLHQRTLKAKKNRRHKKNKQKMDLKRRIVTVYPKKKLDSVAENLMSVDITEDVSVKLKKSQKHARKQKKIKEKKTESKNDNENRSDI